MDIFDRIAAAIKLMASGTPATDPAVLEHLNAIDQHLVDTDAHETADHAESDVRIATIEAGLAKIANAVAPAAAPAPEGEAAV